MSARGAITPEIIDKAKELLGVGLTVRQLRLLPYIAYCLQNDRKIDRRRINEEERGFINDWHKRGWLKGGASADSLRASKKFWDAMSEILWLGFVNYDDSAV